MEISIAKAKDQFSACVKKAVGGEVIVIQRHGHPVAKMTGIRTAGNSTIRFDCGEGSVRISGDLTEPAIPTEDWESL